MTPPSPPPSSDLVVAFPRRADASEHEIASQEALAGRLASLLGRRFDPSYRPSRRRGEPPPYFVPDRTLIGVDRAGRLGINRAADLYGGVAPHSFVAGKSITHGLIDVHAKAPAAWVRELANTLRDVVLSGYTAFTPQDAEAAGLKLLKQGAVRIKPADGIAGRGQVVARNAAELRAGLAEQSAPVMRRLGLVLEEDLKDVVTYSVGWARVGKMEIAYVGTQSLTPDNQGTSVYGGSELRLARGGFDALRALDLSADERLAVDLACHYDAAVSTAYPALFASRRNYDVAFGLAASGEIRSGVLEQSWRAGGASLAELAAMQSFAQSPVMASVRAATRERYGHKEPAPHPERLVFHGVDSSVGHISKSGGVLQETDEENADGGPQ
ncbi:DUF3182 family protein [Achromobacter seleniivolatilans]|uniref:DUF3182 family protein n=1 Tax=Achromobacter seleniivolatilans TaxID=3047478 RepID=A0ABY9M5B0_9BURK|nr:DUF3182 family protein [Achromobacter sp. R39]WMD22208.1 DUF3182 family protein [Achromobacter sp. R39]